jgi:hypothetical protein
LIGDQDFWEGKKRRLKGEVEKEKQGKLRVYRRGKSV